MNVRMRLWTVLAGAATVLVAGACTPARWWGGNADGQLGNGTTTTDATTPVTVIGIP